MKTWIASKKLVATGLPMALSGLVALSFLVVVPRALAQSPADGTGQNHPPMERMMRPPGDHGRWWDNPHVVEKLKLTDDQRKMMDDIYQQHRLKLVDLHAALDREEQTLQPLMSADQPDEASVLREIDKVAQARAELEKANARMLFEVRRQLTREQWKQVQEQRRMREHQGRGPDGWHGPGATGVPAGSPPPPPPGVGPASPQSGPTQNLTSPDPR